MRDCEKCYTKKKIKGILVGMRDSNIGGNDLNAGTRNSNIGENDLKVGMCNSNIDINDSNVGMTTIEACFLIPISIMIIMLLLWLGFYKYDLCVISEAASVASMSGAMEINRSNEEINQLVNEKINELLKEQLIFVRDMHWDIYVSATEVTVIIRGEFFAPTQLFLSDIYTTNAWNFEIEKSSLRINPSMLLRMSEIIHE